VSSDPDLLAAADQIIEAGRRMDRFGWVPSFGGNISARLDERVIAITRSGCRKGFLAREHVIKVDLAGNPLVEGDRPSAETLLHCQIYEILPWVGAVLHGHSIPATVLSRLTAGTAISFSGYEMIKAFEGQLTHETTVKLPVIENSQDMHRLKAELAAIIPECTMGYVLRGHGVYVWGRDVGHATANLEGLEFLLKCELETLKCSRGASA
jgi:methylthioribulose-1-phosphate dehydratase